MNIVIAGASGYTGLELLRILSVYDEVNIVQITSRQYAGKKLVDIFPHFKKSRFENLIFDGEIDLEIGDFYFLCLPHEPSVELVYKLYKKNKKVIDLSAAYRIKNEQAYRDYYRFEHKRKDLLKQASYGLPEIFRDSIKNSPIVANPGCYPTASLLALYPSIKEKCIDGDSIIINALSGISGAGRKLRESFHFPEAYGNAYAYNPINHRHIPEMEDVIYRVSKNKIKINFTPHILPVSRGMISTVKFYTPLKKSQLVELYNEIYKKEIFIRICDKPPKIRNVVGSNFCDIYVDKDERTGLAVIISAIDNLGKGASSQAVQNFNILIGKKEDYNLSNIVNTGILYP